MNHKFSAIILSAGLSSRMNEFKPFLRLGNKTLIENAVHLVLSAGIRDIKVVTGFRSEEVSSFLQRLKVSSVNNPLYKEGMFTSVKAGVSSLGQCDAFFILPVDIPLIKKNTFKLLMRAYSGVGEILYPVFDGKRGHPPLISIIYIESILKYDGADGLYGFLKQHDDKSREVMVADQGILLDCDDPEDYNDIVERFESGAPSREEILELYRMYGLEDNIIAHCKAVASLSYFLAKSLNTKECDLRLITAAGLLHDIARKESLHDKKGAEILNDLGYAEVADIVGQHIDIELDDKRGKPSLAEIIYLADKLIEETETVDLSSRFEEKMQKEKDLGIRNLIGKRLSNALQIKERVEKASGRTLDGIISEYKRDYLEPIV